MNENPYDISLNREELKLKKNRIEELSQSIKELMNKLYELYRNKENKKTLTKKEIGILDTVINLATQKHTIEAEFQESKKNSEDKKNDSENEKKYQHSLQDLLRLECAEQQILRKHSINMPPLSLGTLIEILYNGTKRVKPGKRTKTLKLILYKSSGNLPLKQVIAALKILSIKTVESLDTSNSVGVILSQLYNTEDLIVSNNDNKISLLGMELISLILTQIFSEDNIFKKVNRDTIDHVNSCLVKIHVSLSDLMPIAVNTAIKETEHYFHCFIQNLTIEEISNRLSSLLNILNKNKKKAANPIDINKINAKDIIYKINHYLQGIIDQFKSIIKTVLRNIKKQLPNTITHEILTKDTRNIMLKRTSTVNNLSNSLSTTNIIALIKMSFTLSLFGAIHPMLNTKWISLLAKAVENNIKERPSNSQSESIFIKKIQQSLYNLYEKNPKETLSYLFFNRAYENLTRYLQIFIGSLVDDNINFELDPPIGDNLFCITNTNNNTNPEVEVKVEVEVEVEVETKIEDEIKFTDHSSSLSDTENESNDYTPYTSNAPRQQLDWLNVKAELSEIINSYVELKKTFLNSISKFTNHSDKKNVEDYYIIYSLIIKMKLLNEEFITKQIEEKRLRRIFIKKRAEEKKEEEKKTISYLPPTINRASTLSRLNSLKLIPTNSSTHDKENKQINTKNIPNLSKNFNITLWQQKRDNKPLAMDTILSTIPNHKCSILSTIKSSNNSNGLIYTLAEAMFETGNSKKVKTSQISALGLEMICLLLTHHTSDQPRLTGSSMSDCLIKLYKSTGIPDKAINLAIAETKAYFEYVINQLPVPEINSKKQIITQIHGIIEEEIGNQLKLNQDKQPQNTTPLKLEKSETISELRELSCEDAITLIKMAIVHKKIAHPHRMLNAKWVSNLVKSIYQTIKGHIKYKDKNKDTSDVALEKYFQNSPQDILARLIFEKSYRQLARIEKQLISSTVNPAKSFTWGIEKNDIYCTYNPNTIMLSNCGSKNTSRSKSESKSGSGSGSDTYSLNLTCS